MQKVQKVDSINIQIDCKTTSKKRKDSYCVFTCSGKVQEGGQHQYTEIMCENEQKPKINLICVLQKYLNSNNNNYN